MRRAIFGGTFDPIHYGHLLLAEWGRQTCRFDQVIFVPAGIPPHKRARIGSGGEDRYRMVRAAIAGYPEYDVERFEIDSDEVSYTIKTVEYLEQKYPGDELFLIIGSETLSDLPNWYDTKRLCAKVKLAVAHRAGFPPPDFSILSDYLSPRQIQIARQSLIPMPQVEISSTLIRQMVAQKKSIRFLTPPAAECYITKQGLYGG